MTTLYPRAIASTANASIAVAKNGSLKSRTMAPISIVDAPRRLRACGFGRYPNRRDATRTRSRVSAAIGTRVGASLRTRETVLWETPAARAMSRIVVIDRGRAPSRRSRPADGAFAPSGGCLPIVASLHRDAVIRFHLAHHSLRRLSAFDGKVRVDGTGRPAHLG